jgi:TolB-like protein
MRRLMEKGMSGSDVRTKGFPVSGGNGVARRSGLRKALLAAAVFASLSLSGCGGVLFRGELPNRVAVLPFENLSGVYEVRDLVMASVKKQLREQGVDLVDDEDLWKVLLEMRVRSFGSLPEDVAAVLGERLGVRSVLVGCVFYAAEEDNPELGLTARLIDTKTGRIVWAEQSAATGAEFAKALGLGRIDTLEGLVPEAAGRLLSTFTVQPMPLLQQESTFKIAVIPFENNTKTPHVGTVASYIFLVELFKSRRFDVIEYGDVRKALMKLRMRPVGELREETIQVLSDSLGADGILLGSVDEFLDGRSVALPPKVELTARLLDARRNRILWYDSVRTTGAKDMVLLTWEQTKSLIQTAYEAASAATIKLENVRWY